MMKLLKKEFMLCMHPAAWAMLATGALALVPNYPYGVSCFYMALGLFFICLTARENHDAAYTLSLPVSRRDAVRGRMGLAVGLELAQLILSALMILLRVRFPDGGANAAGMDANLALPGQMLILFGAFNLAFFPAYYRDINRVGPPFVIGAAVMFLLILGDIVGSYTVPVLRDVLDTPGAAHPAAKLTFLAAGAALFAIMTALAERLAVKRFERADLTL